MSRLLLINSGLSMCNQFRQVGHAGQAALKSKRVLVAGQLDHDAGRRFLRCFIGAMTGLGK